MFFRRRLCLSHFRAFTTKPSFRRLAVVPLPLLPQTPTPSPSPPPPLEPSDHQLAESLPINSLSDSDTLLTSLINLLCQRRSFYAAWTLLLSSSPAPLASFAPLFRRYARANRPSSAVRTLHFILRHPECVSAAGPTDEVELDPVHLLVDALCKEGHVRYAAEFVVEKQNNDNWVPSVRIYNSLLRGWFHLRRLKKVEKLWDEMRGRGVKPTVVTYGTLIEGLCRMRRPEMALRLLDEMSSSGVEPNHYTCNPIVDSLAEDGRFEDALAMLEKMPMYGVSPNISTFNSLVKGFCKNRNLEGASDILKQMIKRDILPTTKTYNYFFLFFAKYGKVEEGMNLHAKMVDSGYQPDRLTYHLLIKMLCEKDKVHLAVQMINEMNANGFESDLATSTMHVHLLCRSRRFEEACHVFEEMFQRGIVPQYITYRMLIKELQRLGLKELEEKLTGLINSVPHSTKLPDSYRDGGEVDCDKLRKKSIIEKARVMSDLLKESDASGAINSTTVSDVQRANRLVTDINRRIMQMHSEKSM